MKKSSNIDNLFDSQPPTEDIISVGHSSSEPREVSISSFCRSL